MKIEGTPRKGSNVNIAGVTNEGELLTRAISIPVESHAVTKGDGFAIYTQKITLTDANRHAVVYFKTNEDRDVIISGVTIGTSPSTGGANNALLVEQIGNILPTDDIVANGVDLLVANRNSGSAEEFAGIVKGGIYDDFAAGVAGQGVIGDFTKPLPFDLLSELSKGSQIGLVLQAPSGNTSMDVTVTMSFFRVEE